MKGWHGRDKGSPGVCTPSSLTHMHMDLLPAATSIDPIEIYFEKTSPVSSKIWRNSETGAFVLSRKV